MSTANWTTADRWRDLRTGALVASVLVNLCWVAAPAALEGVHRAEVRLGLVSAPEISTRSCADGNGVLTPAEMVHVEDLRILIDRLPAGQRVASAPARVARPAPARDPALTEAGL